MNQLDKNYTSKRFWIRCFCFVAIFVSGMIFMALILQPFWLNIIKDKIIFDINNLSRSEQKFLNSLIMANKIHTAEFAFDRIVHFYENLITIILGLSAFLGISGYLYIKSSHQRDIEEGIYSFSNSKQGESILKAISQNFFKEAFNRALNEDVLKGIIENNAQNTDDIDNILKRLALLEDNLGNNNSEKISIPGQSISKKAKNKRK